MAVGPNVFPCPLRRHKIATNPPYRDHDPRVAFPGNTPWNHECRFGNIQKATIINRVEFRVVELPPPCARSENSFTERTVSQTAQSSWLRGGDAIYHIYIYTPAQHLENQKTEARGANASRNSSSFHHCRFEEPHVSRTRARSLSSLSPTAVEGRKKRTAVGFIMRRDFAPPSQKMRSDKDRLVVCAYDYSSPQPREVTESRQRTWEACTANRVGSLSGEITFVCGTCLIVSVSVRIIGIAHHKTTHRT